MAKQKKSIVRKKEHPEKFSDMDLHHHRTMKDTWEKPSDIHTDHDFHHEQPFKESENK
ncbi:hypothetical protein BH11BAC1_BH11BAC1_16300 [soil metagenome]